jgi:hypothetical protein
MKEHDFFFFFWVMCLNWSNQSSIWLKTDVSIVEIIAPCDRPWLLDLPIINRCELILLFFFFLFLFPFCGYRHIRIFVFFVTTLEEKSTSCNFYISLLDVRFPLFFGHRLYNYFPEICSSSCGLCHGTLEMIFIWVFYTHGTGITSYISFQ